MDYYTLEDFEGDSKRFEKMRHRKEESYMKKPKYQNYRVCYENGNPATGTKIYELYKNCDCPDCKYRTAGKREPVNRATATTKDISKVDEVAEFLKKWTCGDGRRYLEIAYYKF